ALRDLGEHRLKDLSAPERIYQVGEEEFASLKALYRTNLPVPATPFLGREHELGQVVDLLSGTRLLTLTGPGGTGKTRLSLQAAAETLERYPDGAWFVELAPLTDPALVPQAAATALGLRESAGLVPGEEGTARPPRRTPVDQLVQFEAVRLFLDRATAVLPSFALTEHNAPAVAEICCRLDGIPLAIELAAARVKFLPPEQLLARLEDRFRLLTGGSRTA